MNVLRHFCKSRCDYLNNNPPQGVIGQPVNRYLAVDGKYCLTYIINKMSHAVVSCRIQDRLSL